MALFIGKRRVLSESDLRLGQLQAAVFSQDGIVDEVIDHAADIQTLACIRGLTSLFTRAAARFLASKPHRDRLTIEGLQFTTGLTLCEEYDDIVHSASFSPCGKLVVTAREDGSAYVFRNVEAGAPCVQRRLADTFCNWGPMRSASFSPRGNRLVTGSEDMEAVLWDLAEPQSFTTFRSRTQECVNAASFSPCGERLVTASRDGSVRLWDVVSGKCQNEVRCCTEGGVNAASFSPCGTKMVAATDEGLVILWDVTTEEPQIRRLVQYDDRVNSASFSPCGKKVVSACVCRAYIREVTSGAHLRILRGHLRMVYSASFSPCGARVVTSSANNTTRIWDVESGAELMELPGDPLGHIRAA